MTNQQMPLYKLIISDVPPIQAAPRTYNVPTCTEVSAIIVGDGVGSQAPSRRDIIINIGGVFIKFLPLIHHMTLCHM